MSAKSDYLTVKDVAARMGVSRWTAQRWLRRMEGAHGSAVVVRRGSKLLTTGAALEAVSPASARKTTALEERVALLEATVQRLVREGAAKKMSGASRS